MRGIGTKWAVVWVGVVMLLGATAVRGLAGNNPVDAY